MIDDLSNEQEPGKPLVVRPRGLTVICILTFIFSGLSCVSYLFYTLNYNHLSEFNSQYLELIKNSPYFKGLFDIEVMTKTLDLLTKTSPWFYILTTLLYSASLAGAILMFRLRKVGFHAYTVAQILLLIIPLIYMSGFKTDFSNIIVTTVFILIYATHLRIMK